MNNERLYFQTEHIYFKQIECHRRFCIFVPVFDGVASLELVEYLAMRVE